MRDRKTLLLCMGSACHQSGGFRLIPRLEGLIERHGVRDRLELKGAFCLDRCGAGGVLEIDGEVLTGIVGADLDELFRVQILPRVTGG